MSQDVEIIEIVNDIIEISDDEILLDEDSNDLLAEDTVVKETADEKVNICIESDDSNDIEVVDSTATATAQITEVNNSTVSQNAIPKQTATGNAPIPAYISQTLQQHIGTEDSKIGIVSNEDFNVSCTRNCDDQEVTNSNKNLSSADEHSILNKRIDTSHEPNSKNVTNFLKNQIINKRKPVTPTRRRTIIKRKVSKSSVNKTPTHEIEQTALVGVSSNSSIVNNLNGKIDSHVQVQVTCSSITPSFVNGINGSTDSVVQEQATCSLIAPSASCNSNKRLNNYDFSKLQWLKPLNSLSSPAHLQIVIIDRGQPNWRIENDKWLMIEKRLLEALNSEMVLTNNASIGLFDGAKWQRGIKIVGCHNEDAFNFITKFITNLDKLWYGAKLEAFPISNISRHTVKVYIPPPTLKTDLVMSLIKLQNPSICSKDWEIMRERERPNNGGVDIWITINEESFKQLRRMRGQIKYGINRIWANPSRY